MDYICGRFGDCSFSRFGSIVRQTDRQTDRETDRHTDADERFSLVGVSIKVYHSLSPFLSYSNAISDFLLHDDLRVGPYKPRFHYPS